MRTSSQRNANSATAVPDLTSGAGCSPALSLVWGLGNDIIQAMKMKVQRRKMAKARKVDGSRIIGNIWGEEVRLGHPEGVRVRAVHSGDPNTELPGPRGAHTAQDQAGLRGLPLPCLFARCPPARGV